LVRVRVRFRCKKEKVRVRVMTNMVASFTSVQVASRDDTVNDANFAAQTISETKRKDWTIENIDVSNVVALTHGIEKHRYFR